MRCAHGARRSGLRSCSHARPVKDLADVPEKEPPGLRTEATLAALALLSARAYRRSAKRIAQSYRDLQAVTPVGSMGPAIERWAAQQLADLRADRAALTRALAQRYEQFTTQLDNQLTRQVAKVTGGESRDPTVLAVALLFRRTRDREKADRAVKLTADQIDKRSRALVEQIETTVVAAALYANQVWPSVRTAETIRKAAAVQSRAAADVAWSYQTAAAIAAYEEAGIEYATWTTQGDDRVRPKHQAFSGRVYKLSEGLEGVQAGEEINCRCYPVPKRPGFKP